MIKVLCGKEYKKLCDCRCDNSHKGSFGTLGIVCGSECYQGAVTFAASAALHSGVGIAVAFVPEPVYVPLASKISGAVIEKMNSKNGMLCDGSLPYKILSRKCTAVLFGSGVGISGETSSALHSVCELDLPLVIDGDGLSLLSKDITILERKAVTVLTPHIGEFSKLSSLSPDYVRRNRVSLSMEFAKQNNCTVVLKDYVTVIADGENAFILSNPTCALSKGGSGDVLAGFISSFIAQGISATDACIFAVTLHNGCGKFCEKHFGRYFTQPENIIDSIPHLLK